MEAQPKVVVQNADGTTRTNYNAPVSLSIASGTGTPGTALCGTTTVNAVSGIATYNSVCVNQAADNVNIFASIGNEAATEISRPINVTAVSTSARSGAGYFHALSQPYRFYDSRQCGNPRDNGGWIYPGMRRAFTPIGKGPIPADTSNNKVTAILANVTAVAPRDVRKSGDDYCNPTPASNQGAAQGEGFLTVMPDFGDDSNQTISVRWYRGGQWTVANYAMIGLSEGGAFKVLGRGSDANKSQTDFFIDVYGFVDSSAAGSSQYSAGGVYKPITGSQFRLYDSRPSGTNIPNPPQGTGDSLLRVGNVRNIQFTGNFGIPNSATAAVVNVTVANSELGGYFTLYPTGSVQPDSTYSTVNRNDKNTPNVIIPLESPIPDKTPTITNIPGDIANMAIVPLGSSGSNSGNLSVIAGGIIPQSGTPAGANLIIDVIGYVDSVVTNTDSKYFSLSSPSRLYDSRPSEPDYPGASIKGWLAPGAVRSINGSDLLNIPSGATALVVHLAIPVVETGGGGGFISLYRGEPWPGNSNVNVNNTGQQVGNLAIVSLDSSGQFLIFNGGGRSKDVILDVVGYFFQTGQTQIQTASRSYYVQDTWGKLDTNSGRINAYRAGQEVPGGTAAIPVIILDFGRPTNNLTGVQLPRSSDLESLNWVKDVANAFMEGYNSMSQHRLAYIAIATNNSVGGNSPWVCQNNPATLDSRWRAHGEAWGTFIGTLNRYSKVILASGNDFETWRGDYIDGWESCGLGAQVWLDGFNSTKPTAMLNIDFGSSKWNQSPALWTKRQVYDVAWAKPGATTLPEIYCKNNETPWRDLQLVFSDLFVFGVTSGEGQPGPGGVSDNTCNPGSTNPNYAIPAIEAWNKLKSVLLAGSIGDAITIIGRRGF